jgi:hypothetical protein
MKAELTTLDNADHATGDDSMDSPAASRGNIQLIHFQ